MSQNTCPILARLFAAAAASTLVGAAHAQLHLPSLGGLPPIVRLPLVQRVEPLVDPVLAPVNLAAARLQEVARRARADRRELDRDPHGELIVRAEVLAQPSGAPARDALAAAGFKTLREQALEGLDEALIVMRPPVGMTLSDAVERARTIDPAGAYDFHHLYEGGGSVGAPASTAVASASAPVAAPVPAGLRIGLIDSGVDTRHPAFANAAVQGHGCGDDAHPAPHPAAHGTAVASLMIGEDGVFRSALPRATLYAADVYCDAPTGGSVEAIARELAWLARMQVAVVNVSLVGPPDQILQRVVAQAVARGMLIVAAVGNDGPAAPPLYPASWPGVVGVGAVDGRLRLLPEGARGPQVMFVAPGADMAAAANGARGFVPVRGTSFAAPLVAGLLAAQLQSASPAGARDAIGRLAANAHEPAGTPSHDAFGRGLVGEALRTAPDAVALVR
jgi:subtilisin family serine protease